jgi:4-hydroxythreonine-4-phosphate dehydrogenase
MTATPPRVAITLGDVAGIGPEVVVRAVADPRVRSSCRPVFVGHPGVIRRALELAGVELAITVVDTLAAAHDDDSSVPCVNPAGDDAAQVPPGHDDARAGAAAFQYLIAATRAALTRDVDALVTAPLSKHALHLAGHNYPGHTEILAETCGVSDFAMMLYLPECRRLAPRVEHCASEAGRIAEASTHGARGLHYGLGIAHVTLHTSIASVPALITHAAVNRTIGLVHTFMQRVGCASPRVGVCALNPHAGEQGLFGDEERRVIAPAVQQAVLRGINAAGPFPADTLLKRAVAGEFDGVVAMYHDQGHIALKLIGFNRAVNVTLGLPIIRTSPSHGTAFDIAWQGTAEPTGMIEAIRVAVQLARSAPGNR